MCPHYKTVLEILQGFSAREIERRERLQKLSLLNQGITFTVYGEKDGIERIFPFDFVPRIIPAAEWRRIEAGLIQRITTLGLFLLDICRRASDDAEDLARRHLLFERRREITVARLQLAEEPHVLDRDHRLIGEGLEERDLVVSEAAGLAAAHRDRSDRLVVTQHRHTDLTSVTTNTSGGAPRFEQSGIGGCVGDTDRCAIAQGLGVFPLGVGRLREAHPQGSVTSVVGARERGEVGWVEGCSPSRSMPKSRTSWSRLRYCASSA